MKEISHKPPYFTVQTPLGITVSTTSQYWKIITEIKHPSIKGQESKLKETLMNPDIIRKSSKDPNVLLFYRHFARIYLCVVIKRLEETGFIVTAYFTENIKEGEHLWKK